MEKVNIPSPPVPPPLLYTLQGFHPISFYIGVSYHIFNNFSVFNFDVTTVYLIALKDIFARSIIYT